MTPSSTHVSSPIFNSSTSYSPTSTHIPSSTPFSSLYHILLHFLLILSDVLPQVFHFFLLICHLLQNLFGSSPSSPPSPLLFYSLFHFSIFSFITYIPFSSHPALFLLFLPFFLPRAALATFQGETIFVRRAPTSRISIFNWMLENIEKTSPHSAQ